MRDLKRATLRFIRSSWFVLACVLLAASLIMLTIGYGVLDYYLSHAEGLGAYAAPQDPAKLGTLGDFFGGILNPVFGFLSVVGLLVAVMLQRDQLAQIKREAIESGRAADKKAFEDTFFQMIRLHQEILNAIELSEEGGSYRGRAAIHRMYLESFSEYDFLEQCQGWEDREEFLCWLNDYYEDNYLRFGDLIEQYYQSIENIASFLYASSIRNKAFYARLLRGQFSQTELLLMFFHTLRDEAFLLKDYIEELALFEGLRPENLPDYSLLSLYEAGAYGMGLSKWGGLRSGNVTELNSPVSLARATKAIAEMMAASRERLDAVKAGRLESLSAGQSGESEAGEIAKLEMEVGRLARLHKALS